ncbi:MAG: hypothetical protein XE09_0088 [Atribacteria bacterium 34_868]|nr:MAG: hypothetical protein XE09_0088 [Atribacteria bacterium 34_868]
MKKRSISAVASKSAITPYCKGRMVYTPLGVLPIMVFASAPTFNTRWLFFSYLSLGIGIIEIPIPKDIVSYLKRVFYSIEIFLKFLYYKIIILCYYN